MADKSTKFGVEPRLDLSIDFSLGALLTFFDFPRWRPKSKMIASKNNNELANSSKLLLSHLTIMLRTKIGCMMDAVWARDGQTTETV